MVIVDDQMQTLGMPALANLTRNQMLRIAIACRVISIKQLYEHHKNDHIATRQNKSLMWF